jgi:hypothetical protein
MKVLSITCNLIPNMIWFDNMTFLIPLLYQANIWAAAPATPTAGLMLNKQICKWYTLGYLKIPFCKNPIGGWWVTLALGLRGIE